MSILIETIQDLNEDQNQLSEIVLISEIGSSLIFLKSNQRDCIDLFGAKVTSELIEESVLDYKEIMQEGFSSNAPEKSPPIDFKAIWETIKDKGDVIGGAALAALVIAGSYKIYKNYFSKAAKSCKGKSGEEKTACMTNYRENAYKLQQDVLKKSLDMSNKSKDPSVFKKKIEIQIRKLKK